MLKNHLIKKNCNPPVLMLSLYKKDFVYQSQVPHPPSDGCLFSLLNSSLFFPGSSWHTSDSAAVNTEASLYTNKQINKALQAATNRLSCHWFLIHYLCEVYDRLSMTFNQTGCYVTSWGRPGCRGRHCAASTRYSINIMMAFLAYLALCVYLFTCTRQLVYRGWNLKRL